MYDKIFCMYSIYIPAGILDLAYTVNSFRFYAALMVPTEGFEPPHLAAHGPEPCASTNSATWAFFQLLVLYLHSSKLNRHNLLITCLSCKSEVVIIT